MKKLLITIAAMIMPMLANADAAEINGIYYNLSTKGKVAEVTYKRSGEYYGNGVVPEMVEYERTEYSVTSTGEKDPVVVEINETNFPDNNFRQYLLEQDYGKDGVITQAEIKNIYDIDVSNKEICDLKGIEFFSELKGLECSENKLTSLDISHNIALESLNCSLNQLEHLDVSYNIKLKQLQCVGNVLTSVDVSNNTELVFFSCSGNQIEHIDITQNTLLDGFNCDFNLLTSLDVSHNKDLILFNCGVNNLSSIDVSHNTKLQYFYCDHNSITDLDISQNIELIDFHCYYNKISCLNVSNNKKLEIIACFTNQISESNMDMFISSLPIQDNAELTIYYEWSDDKNVCTTKQVEVAKNKGWRVLKFYNEEYLGSNKLIYILDDKEYKTYNIEYGKEIISEPEPTKEGYTFSGWTGLPATMPANDITVTGSFSINNYKLTYILDGAEYKSYDVEYGTNITQENEPIKEGYTFSGWSEIPETMPAHDVTVTGTFNINKYKLIYIVDGEEYKSYDVEYGTTISPEAAPTKEGHTFSGWSVTPSKMPAEDVTVMGTFTINKYKLTYIVDGIEYKSYDIEYDATISPEIYPEEKGYTFSGWSDIPATMPANDVTIFGFFTINQYIITYIIDGELYTTETVDFNSIIMPPTPPSRDGYDFAWEEYPETMPAKDITISGSYTTSIKSSNINSDNVKIFTIGGKQGDKPQKGVNIIKMIDRTTKKVLVK